jgi:hypothetical protein
MALVILILLYFIPTFIVLSNKHPSGLAIGLLNLFLGWTLIGWLVCLIWAVVRPAAPQQIIINNVNNVPVALPSPVQAPYYIPPPPQALRDRTAIYRNEPEDLTKRLENFEIKGL